MKSIKDFVEISESIKNLPVITLLEAKDKNKYAGNYAIGFGTPDNPMSSEEVKRLIDNTDIKYKEFRGEPNTLATIGLRSGTEIYWTDPSKYNIIK